MINANDDMVIDAIPIVATMNLDVDEVAIDRYEHMTDVKDSPRTINVSDYVLVDKSLSIDDYSWILSMCQTLSIPSTSGRRRFNLKHHNPWKNY